MPSEVALLLCSLLVFTTLAWDNRRTQNISGALWVPFLWFAVVQSRPVTGWFDVGGTRSLSANIQDGAPLDRNLLSLLMLIGGLVLIKRKTQLGQWIKKNPWLFAFFFYCGVSIIWSDFPGVAFKRWIRAAGSLVMILVVLTEKDPVAAVVTLVRRCAYLLVPVSIVLIKYYRHLAVAYNPWTGAEVLVGVTTDKNALGRLCLISGLFAFWEFVSSKGNLHIQSSKANRCVSIAVFALTIYLLKISNSATSLATFLLGCGIILALGLPVIKKGAKHLGIIVTGVVFLVFVALSLDMGEVVVAGLGRNLTFTDRTFIWQDLLNMNTNPLVGVGYDSFWLGSRLDTFVRKYEVNTAHNGYLEVYLELGMVGLFLLAGLLVSVFNKAKKSLTKDDVYGRLQMAVWAVFLVYNITESGYKATTSIFCVLLLVAIDFTAKCEFPAAITMQSAGFGKALTPTRIHSTRQLN